MILTSSNFSGILEVVDIHVHCQVVLLYVSQQLAKATKFVSFGIALLPGYCSALRYAHFSPSFAWN
jgi:hypothetical protein